MLYYFEILFNELKPRVRKFGMLYKKEKRIGKMDGIVKIIT